MVDPQGHRGAGLEQKVGIPNQIHVAMDNSHGGNLGVRTNDSTIIKVPSLQVQVVRDVDKVNASASKGPRGSPCWARRQREFGELRT